MAEQKSKSNSVLTDADCTNILANYLKRTDWTLVSYTIDSLSDKVEGLLGEHFIVTIQYTTSDSEANQRFFLKLLNGTSPFIFEMTQDINAYEKESFFYQTLLPAFDTYGVDISFAPKEFLSRPFLVVLEDMSTYGFKTFPKKLPFDVVHTQIALKTLAKFHVASIAYEVKRRKMEPGYSLKGEHGEIFAETVFSGKETAATRWVNASITGVLGIIQNLPEDKDSTLTNTEFIEKLMLFMETITKAVSAPTDSVCVALHGDLWSNNILFRYEKELPVESVLIDFQILKYGVPATDVLHLLNTNTRHDLRKEHSDSLLAYYYSQLEFYLKENELDVNDILSLDEFLAMCEEVALPCKIQAIIDRSTTYLSEETFGPLMGNDAELRRFLMEDIGKSIVASYEENEEFREMIGEDIRELRSMLCASL